MSIQESVKAWVSIDNRIKTLNENLKELRDQRRTQEETMITWANDVSSKSGASGAAQKPVIKITDGKLRFVETKQTAPLTLKYVEERLRALLSAADGDKMVDLIMEDLKTNRETKVVREVKRVYDK